MPPESDRYYLSQIRADFAIQNPYSAYRPGHVVGEGSLHFDDPEAIKKMVDTLRDMSDNINGGPDLAELEQTYRV